MLLTSSIFKVFQISNYHLKFTTFPVLFKNNIFIKVLSHKLVTMNRIEFILKPHTGGNKIQIFVRNKMMLRACCRKIKYYSSMASLSNTNIP